MTWRERAACLGMPDQVFFDDTANQFATARRVCASCPVIAECRAMCDAHEGMGRVTGLYGIFAGEDPRQRFNRRKNDRAKRKKREARS